MATTDQDQALRSRLRGVPGVTPEDTRSELLAANDRSSADVQTGPVFERRAIEARTDSLRFAAKDSLSKADAGPWVVADARSMASIEDKEDRFFAGSMMNEAADQQPAYKAELRAYAPQLAEELELMAAEGARREVAKDERKAGSSAFIDPSAAERTQRGTQDRAAVSGQGEGGEARVRVGYTAQDDVHDRAEARLPPNPNWAASWRIANGIEQPTDRESVAVPSSAEWVRQQHSEIERDRPEAEVVNEQFQAAVAARQSVMATPEYRERESAERLQAMRDLEARDERAQRGAQERAAGAGAAAVDEGTFIDPSAAERTRRGAQERQLLSEKEDRERARAMTVEQNSVDLKPSGRELERADIIVPRRIVQTYTEVDGKFFAKDSNRVMFEDKGEKLATSTTDKQAIADMVQYARAKQWESLKLSGSQEFRREAWLQAESQGIKTQGYTPKDADLAALKVLQQERATNAITPLQERDRKAPVAAQEKAPARAASTPTLAGRHDLNKNQAAIHAEASKNVATNMQALQKRPGLADRSAEELAKLAYWRGVVQEETKRDPVRQEQAVARFDVQAEDPQFVKRLNQETKATIDDKTVDRTKPKTRDTPEHTL